MDILRLRQLLLCAERVANQSTEPIKVGAVVVSGKYLPLSIGYNYALPGSVKSPLVVHAEQHALLNLDKPDMARILVCTHHPCVLCAHLICNYSCIRTVITAARNRNELSSWASDFKRARELFSQSGIALFHL